MFYFHGFLHLDLQRLGKKQSVDGKFSCLINVPKRRILFPQIVLLVLFYSEASSEPFLKLAGLSSSRGRLHSWLSPIYTCANGQPLSTQRTRKYESITTDQLSISTGHIIKSNPIFIISHLLQPRKQLREVDSLFEMEKIMENIIDFTLQMPIQRVSVSFS